MPESALNGNERSNERIVSPILASERGEDCPLVVAGGPVAYNCEPVAGLFDIGDKKMFPFILQG